MVLFALGPGLCFRPPSRKKRDRDKSRHRGPDPCLGHLHQNSTFWSPRRKQNGQNWKNSRSHHPRPSFLYMAWVAPKGRPRCFAGNLNWCGNSSWSLLEFVSRGSSETAISARPTKQNPYRLCYQARTVGNCHGGAAAHARDTRCSKPE